MRAFISVVFALATLGAVAALVKLLVAAAGTAFLILGLLAAIGAVNR